MSLNYAKCESFLVKDSQDETDEPAGDVTITGELSAKIHKAMMAKGWTAQVLENKSGVDRVTVWRVIKSDGDGSWSSPRNLRRANLVKLLHTVGIPWATVEPMISAKGKAAKGLAQLAPDEREILEAYRKLRRAMPAKAPAAVDRMKKLADHAEWIVAELPDAATDLLPPDPFDKFSKDAENAWEEIVIHKGESPSKNDPPKKPPRKPKKQ